MPRQKPAPQTRRLRRTREDIREALLESALTEFGTKGFEGASTLSIANRVSAYQPQINYHFQTKEGLWKASVDHLFALLAVELEGVLPTNPPPRSSADLGAALADAIRRFVRFVAVHPELNQIMVHEGTVATDRLTWMIDTHVRPIFNGFRLAWDALREAGIAAPFDGDFVYYVLVGAASLPFVNAPEVRLLTERDPTDERWIDAHADVLVQLLLPGLTSIHSAEPSRRR